MEKQKLTDAEIEYYEMWAKEKEKGPMTDEEKTVVKHINNYSKNNWQGVRISEQGSTNSEDAKRRLESLKRKEV